MPGEEIELWMNGKQFAERLLSQAGIVRCHFDNHLYDGEEGIYNWYNYSLTSGDHLTLFERLSAADHTRLDNDDPGEKDEPQSISRPMDIDFNLETLESTIHDLQDVNDHIK